jgi:hypothetical protein
VEADVAKIGELKMNLRINALPCRDMKFTCFDGAQCYEGRIRIWVEKLNLVLGWMRRNCSAYSG